MRWKIPQALELHTVLSSMTNAPSTYTGHASYLCPGIHAVCTARPLPAVSYQVACSCTAVLIFVGSPLFLLNGPKPK